MTFGRRAFLVTLAAVGAAFGIFRSRHSIKVFLSGATRKAEPAVGGNPFRAYGNSLVAAVGGREVKAMVEQAVSLIGGLEPLEIKGKSVLVKPNVVGGRRHPTTTNPEVVRAVVELLYEAGASTVYVGDMSALIRGGTAKNMERTGIAAAARQAGAGTLFFEDHAWVRVEINGRYLREVEVTEWFFKVDRVINLPVIKTHRYAGYSICLKNFVGATHFSQRPYLVDLKHWEEVVAELNLAFRPDLNIVDGTRTMVEGGPWEGKTRETNLILAGGDRLACDVVGLGIIKSFGQWPPLASVSPWQMRQVKRAVEIGLGARGSDAMALRTASLDNDSAFASLMDTVRTIIGLPAQDS
ncbi:MAG: DUF362 domain-containing protein [Desulfobulbaceae bacterium]|nr:DUF362 domain-containing protein [Desulfobulbaceae bacterium]